MPATGLKRPLNGSRGHGPGGGGSALKYSARGGVQKMGFSVNIEGDRRYASAGELTRLRELTETHGVSLRSKSWNSGYCGLMWAVLLSGFTLPM